MKKLLEKLAGFKMIILKSFKFLLFGLLILSFFVLTIPLYPFLKLWPMLIRQITAKIMSTISKGFLWILGANVELDGSLSNRKGQLIVCNHLSYFDMIVLLSQAQTSFITSTEIKKTFFLGQICELAGCFYTDRKNKKNIINEVSLIKDGLKAGTNITFFPEATSTDGTEIKKFKKPFFYPALDLGIPVTTITLNYNKINEESFSIGNRDLICWYGKMSFLPHLWNMMSINSLEISLKIREAAPQKDIEQLVSTAESIIRSEFNYIEQAV